MLRLDSSELSRDRKLINNNRAKNLRDADAAENKAALSDEEIT